MSLLRKVSFMPDLLSAFGTLETSELTPVLQLEFTYGVNTQLGASTTVSGATVGTSVSRLKIESGTDAHGNGFYKSRKLAKYRAGQGMVARFAPIFTTGVADSTQIWGMGDESNGYFLGYNGIDFGILHRINGGDTWISQDDWNGDKCDGSAGTSFTWNKEFGVPVMIKYPYLGYGDIFFYVQNPLNGSWVNFHIIRYANTTNYVQATNPTLHFYGQSLNNGNTSNLIMYCGSVGVFISGQRSFVGNPKWSADSNKSGVTTETNLISLRNSTTYNGVPNKSLIRLLDMSVSSSAVNGISIFRLKINPTVGGSPSFSPINGSTADNGVTITSGNSFSSFDVAGTTISGGTYIYSISLDNPNSDIINLVPYDMFVSPSEVLSITAFSSNSSLVCCSINWTEDI